MYRTPSDNSPDNSSEGKGGADSTQGDGPPAGRTRSRTQKSRAGDGRLDSSTGGRNHSAEVPQYIEVGPEFQVINSLGIGRSGTVFKALWHGKEVALKLCDIEHNPEYKQELLTEIKVYNQLQDLQGWYIPRLIMAGCYGYLFLGIVTEVVGSLIEVDQLKYLSAVKL